MKRHLFGLALAATLLVLGTASRAHAWGAYHVGYTHVGPGGVQHWGRTAGFGPYGGFSTGHAGAYGYGGYHAGYGYGYHAGYGGYGYHAGYGYGGYHPYAPAYGGGYAVGGYHYGGYGAYGAGVYRW